MTFLHSSSSLAMKQYANHKRKECKQNENAKSGMEGFGAYRLRVPFYKCPCPKTGPHDGDIEAGDLIDLGHGILSRV